MFYDLEKNTAISYEVKRRITDSNGKRYSTDMVGMTQNAASSIALRNAVLKGVPKAFWKPIYDAARKVVAGDIRTLVNRRGEAMKQFAIFGVKPEQIYTTLSVRGVEDMTIEHLVTLKGILTAIQEGDTTPEQAFATQDSGLAGKSANRLDEIKARHGVQKNGSASAGAPAQAAPETNTSVPPPGPQQSNGVHFITPGCRRCEQDFIVEHGGKIVALDDLVHAEHCPHAPKSPKEQPVESAPIKTGSNLEAHPTPEPSALKSSTAGSGKGAKKGELASPPLDFKR